MTALDFLRTYVRAFVLFALVGLGLVVYVLLLGPGLFHPDTRPTDTPLAPYDLTYVSHPGAEPVRVHVDSDARACTALAESTRIRRICALALSLGANVIAGEAFGRLNSEDTDAYEAIKWRARLEGRVDFCVDAGLLDQRLRACRDAVTSPSFEFKDAGATVRIERPTS